jgi:hypothetical protein
MMRNLSGGAQRKLWSGMIFLGLIKQDGSVTEELRKLIDTKEKPDERKAILANVITKSYAPIIKDLDVTSATAKQLEDAFRAAKVEGTTLIEAIRFYIHARKECGLVTSPYITARQPRSAPRNGDTARARTPRAPRTDDAAAEERTETKTSPPDDERPDEEKAAPPGMMRLPIYIPGKPVGRIEIHEDLLEADVEMINAILMAYAKRRSNSKA